MKLFCKFIIILFICISSLACAENAKSSRSERAIQTWTPKLETALEAKKLSLGSPIFFRIIKTRDDKTGGELQAFVEDTEGQFIHFKSWDICALSGGVGPKKKEGDRQSPEGFYFVSPQSLNPNSNYHLSFNLGYPNTFDRANERTGDFLMVHGDCVSIGSYAMTDEGIEEIYTLLRAAFDGGQPFVRIHAFPFEMTIANMKKYKDNDNYPFWQNLKPGWDYFENTGHPPNVTVKNKRYHFDDIFEKELCFQLIKQAYDADVTWFRIDDRDCLKYLLAFEKKYRGHLSPD